MKYSARSILTNEPSIGSNNLLEFGVAVHAQWQKVATASGALAANA